MNGRVVSGFDPLNPGNPGHPLIAADNHGVACAGIIAASNNSLGIRGVAPNSIIVPVRMFHGVITYSNDDIAEAINWAWDNGEADIISCSWGGGSPHAGITSAITAARTLGRGMLGTIVVASSMNGGNKPVGYPANLPGVIAVGAIDNNGNIWSYSQRGADLNLVAPSGDIDLNGDVRTTDRMGADGYSSGNYIDNFGGTSAAAPQVAGVAALMLSVNPNLTEAQVITILQATATDMGAYGFDNTYGYGRVNAYRAVERVLGGPIAGPTELCNNATYSLPNSPPYSPSWSRVGNPVFNINSSTGYATSISDGQAFVQATMTTACGTVNFRREISVGVPHYNYIIAEAGWIGSGYGKVMASSGETEMEAGYTGLSSILKYGWEIWDHSNWNVSPRTVSWSSVDFDYWHWPTPFNQRILIRAQNSCGWGQYRETYWTFSSFFSAYTISPNPASSHVTLLFEKLIDPKGMPERLELLHESSTIPVRTLKIAESYFESIKNDGNKLSINVSDLPRGTYYLHVDYGGKKEQNRHRVLLR